jgi:cytochrome P450
MPLLPSAVLEDPRYRVPAAPPAGAGLAWLRSQVPRFCDGPEHLRRRARVDRVLSSAVIPNSVVDPTVALLEAFGLPAGYLDDVALVAAAYQPHAPQSPGADAALERLVDACGGRSEEAAARLCLLVQAHAAMRALIAQRRTGAAGPPVPLTRRVAPDGTTVDVDLTDAPFGRGPHACPGRALAEAWAQVLR